jgi:WD40 repeat protein
MTIEEALSVLDQVLGQTTLNDTQELVFRHAWEDWTYERIAEQFGYTTDHIKNVGADLWGALSDLTGSKITKRNLQSMLRRWADHHCPAAELFCAPTRHLRQDWGEAPDSACFTGRIQELATLERWVVNERCRLVALMGMGGMGKTALAVKLAKAIQHQFDYVIWRSLQNAPTASDLVGDWLQFLSDSQEPPATLAADLDSRILRLLVYLRQHRCLLILDNAESVLPCQQQQGFCHEGYTILLKRLSELSHESCLILTSREKPEAIAWNEGITLPVRSFSLEGLNAIDGKTLFASKDTFQATEADWQHLVQHYAGNPLALKIVAAAIQELFNSNVSEFLTILGTFVFDDIRDLIDRQFNCLSALQQDVMYWLAINREITSFTELREDTLSPLAKQKLPGTLRSLKHRFLLEATAAGFTLQPVVMEYVTERLIEQVCQELDSRMLALNSDLNSTIQNSKLKTQNFSPPSYSPISHSTNPLSSDIRPLAPDPFPLLHSHALLKAEAKEYLRESQTRLILNPIANRLLAVRSPKAVKEFAQTLLADLRSQPQLATGYAAGTVINLLNYLKLELTNFDCSNLTIRQAYLQDVELHQTNFANAHFVNSVFNESLGNVWSVAFSPDGKLLAVSDSAGEIHLWRMDDGKKIITFRGHTHWICSVAFSPNGKLLASSSADGTLKLWELATGYCLKTIEGQMNWIVSVAFNREGTVLASSGIDSASIRLWSVATGACLQTLRGHDHWIWAIAFSPTHSILASGSDDCTLKLWNVNTGECLNTIQGHPSNVRSVAFSPCGSLLVSGSDDHTLKLWDAATGECLNTFNGHANHVRSVSFSPSGKTVISASEDRTLKLWDVATGQCLRTFYGHTAHVRSVAFAPSPQPGDRDHSDLEKSDSEQLDGLIASGGADQTVRFWDSRTGQCLKTLQGNASFTLDVAFSPTDPLLASSSADHTIKLWNLQTHQCVNILRGHRQWVWSVVFSPDGKTLASTSFDHTVKLWDVATGACLQTLIGHTHWVWSVAFNANGTQLATSSSDHCIRLWDSATGHCITMLDCHSNNVLSVAFSPCDRVLASGDDDGIVKLWDVHTGTCIQRLTGHTSRVRSVAFTTNGMLVSGSADRTIKIWDWQTGACLNTLTGHTAPIESIAICPTFPPSCPPDKGAQPFQTNVLASSGEDGTLRLWNLAAGECFKVWQGHDRRVWSVTFAPDGKTLASSSEDETIRLWNTETGDCAGILRSPRPYEAMNIAGVTGLTAAQLSTLKTLGAVELEPISPDRELMTPKLCP